MVQEHFLVALQIGLEPSGLDLGLGLELLGLDYNTVLHTILWGQFFI